MRIYLDHNATTPLRDEVIHAMAECLRANWGNPSSTHEEGAAARAAVERARVQVADLVGARPEDVIFTAGATEANNTLLHSLLPETRGWRLVTTTTEHPSIAEAADRVESAGVPVERVGVDGDGRLDAAAIERATVEHTLVSVIWANNETGVLQDVDELSRRVAARGGVLHVDATQALGKIPIDLAKGDVALLSCSAHKLNGPKGTGALVDRGSGLVEPLLHGGGQERRLRGGTENVAGIVGFGVACELARRELDERMRRYAELRDRLWPRALIGFAGPRVIEQTVRETLPEGFQRSEFLLDHGAIDIIVDRREMRMKISSLLTILTGQPAATA